MAYASPYGRPLGLRARLARHRANLSDRSYPWHGMGLIADVELIMRFLDKREWLESLRTNPDPDAQRFADELLADTETLDAVQLAANGVRTPIAANAADAAHRAPTYDPVATVEQLDEAAQSALGAYRQVRTVLEQAGVADDATTDEELPGLIRALLA
jgi:hypothetical protein